MKKYRIIDLSWDIDVDNLEGSWYADYETGEVCSDFDNVQEFTSSLLYNIEVAVEFEDWVDIENAYKSAISNLLEFGYCEVNGFSFEVYEDEE